MKKLLSYFLLLLPCLLNAQDAELEKIINQLNFGPDTVETVFLWITDNIKYDAKRKDEISQNNRNRNSKKGVKSNHEIERIKKVISTKKGVCQDYSTLMDALLQKLNFESNIIMGYTKDFNGKLDSSLGHSWNAVKVGNEWRLYDPTWSAGYLDGTRFVKKYNPKWNNISPEEMIQSHMPCDPIWQLLSEPVSYDDFKESKYEGKPELSQDYNLLISEQLNLDSDDLSSVERSKKMGKANSVVLRWQKYRTKTKEYMSQKGKSEQFKIISAELNEIFESYKEYQKAKKKGFKSKKWSLENATAYLSGSKEKCEKHKAFLDSIETEGANEKKFVVSSLRSIKEFGRILDKEIEYVDRN